MSAYRLCVSIRNLLAIVVALAVLFSPALTRAGEAFAAVPDRHMQMMEAGHCKVPPSHAGDHDSDKDKHKSCCISMCAPAAIATPAGNLDDFMPKSSATFPLPSGYHGNIAEIATPPPRLS